MAKTPKNTTGSKKSVEVLKHDEAKRKNVPTAEYQSILQKEEQSPVRIAYERRQHDQNWSNLMILGDSLQVMASLAEREAMHGH